MIALVIALVVLAVSWPESTEDRVFRGEPWGDILAEGFIWGELNGEHQGVWFYLGETSVTVTNVSAVWLFNPPDGERMNRTVVCQNGTLTIISVPGEFGHISGDWWNVDFYCTYSGFNGTAVSDRYDLYYPDYNVSWLQGRASVIHNDSMDYDIYLSDCLLIIDGVTYASVDYLGVNEGDVAELSVEGRGSVDYGTLFPHINGTLRIENFRRTDDSNLDTYQALVVRGDDIALRTVDTPMYGTGGPFVTFRQWEIEVSASPDASVEILEPLKFSIYAESVVIIVIAVLAFSILVSLRNPPRRANTGTPVAGAGGDISPGTRR